MKIRDRLTNKPLIIKSPNNYGWWCIYFPDGRFDIGHTWQTAIRKVDWYYTLASNGKQK